MSLFGGGGGAVERIGVELIAKTGKFFKQVDGAVDKGTSKFARLGKAVGGAMVKAGAVGGVALAGLGVAAVKMGIDFEKSMAEVRTLLPELADKGFNALRDELLALSSEMGIATDELVPALYQAISAGVPPENVIDFLRVGGKAAIGGVTDLTTAIDGLTTITNAWGLESDEADRVADIMFTGVKLGKTTMAELSASMFQAAPLAAALGVSVEEVVAATATLTKSGVPTSVAMTQMRQAMVSLTKPTADMTKLLEKTGFASGEALIEAKGFTGALEALTVAADNDKEVMGKAFGSVEALGFVLGVTGDNAEVAAADLDAVTNSAGAADEAFETMDDTMSRKLSKAINKIRVMLTRLGLKVLPVLADGIEGVMTFVAGLIAGFKEGDVTSKGFAGTAEKIGKALKKDVVPPIKSLGRLLKNILVPSIEGLIKVMKVVGPPTFKFFKFLKDHKDILRAIGIAIFALMVPSIWAWVTATIANTAAHIALAAATLIAYAPIILMVAAIALLVFGIIQLIRHWDEVVAFFKVTVPAAFASAWQAIDTFLSSLPVVGEVWDVVKRVVGDKIDALIGFIQGLIDFGKEFISFWKNVFSGEWGAAWQDIKDMAMIALGLLLDYLELTFFGTLRSIFAAIVPWDWVKDQFNSLASKVVGILNDVVGAVSGFWLTLWTAGRDIFNSLGDGMKAGLNAAIWVVESGINYIIGAWNALEFNLPKVNLGPLGSVGGGTIGTPDIGFIRIPRLRAHGGPVAAGELVRINELGLEFFRPFSAGTVLPIAPAGPGAGGNHMTNYGRIINVFGPGRQSKDVLRDLDRMVK